MSFLRNSGPQYTSREEQFLRYFRDTGVSHAFQKAMILLYKMPIKPTNLEEFFAEYLENGATELVKHSLLKAELCFKHSETQNTLARIKYLQQHIHNYETQGYGKNRPSRLREKAEEEDGPEEELEKHQPLLIEEEQYNYNVLDRFLGDVDKVLKSQSPSTETSTATVDVEVERKDLDELLVEEDDGVTVMVAEDDEFKDNDDFKEVEDVLVSKERKSEDLTATAPKESEDVTADAKKSGDLSFEVIITADLAPEIKQPEDLTLEMKQSQDLPPEIKKSEDWSAEIKKLDPWGIVCTTTTLPVRPSTGNTEEYLPQYKTEDSYKKKKSSRAERTSLFEDPDKKEVNIDEEMASTTSSEKSDPEQLKYAESDEAETVAEICHAYATSFDNHPPTRRESELLKHLPKIPMHHLHRHTNEWKNDISIPEDKEKDVKLLSVAQPPFGTPVPSKLGEMMGWSRHFCAKAPSAATNNANSISVKPSIIIPEPNWSQFTELNADDQNDEEALLDHCLEHVDFYSDIKWQDHDTKYFPISAKDESFLLDYEMARIARKFDNSNDSGFMFEFNQKFENADPVEKNNMCGNCKKLKKSSGQRANVATSTTGLEQCQCGEDCDCDNMTSAWSRNSSQGKMTNWTKGYGAYPGGDEYEYGEGDHYGKNKGGTGNNKISSSMGEFLEEFQDMEVIVKEVKSTCECADDTTDNFEIYPDECKHYCKVENGPDDEVTPPPPKGERRISLDPELEKAFRESGGYAMEQENKKKDNTAAGPPVPQVDLDDEEHQPKYPSGVYDVLDFEGEVKKVFGVDGQ